MMICFQKENKLSSVRIYVKMSVKIASLRIEISIICKTIENVDATSQYIH